MSIPISGGPYVKDDVLGSSAAIIRDWINDSLVAAGWTSTPVSGGFDVQSATTPQGLTVVAQLRVTGGGEAGITFSNVSGTHVGSSMNWSPTGSPTLRIIASPYQFFTFRPGVDAEISGGCPFIPSFLTSLTTEAWWAITTPSFRTNLTPNASTSDYTFNLNMGSGAGTGSIRLFPLVHGGVGSGSVNIISQWYNGANVVADPLIGWGTSSGAQPRVRGLLWDAAIVLGAYTIDLEDTFEGHGWYNLTNNNLGGSLWLITS